MSKFLTAMAVAGALALGSVSPAAAQVFMSPEEVAAEVGSPGKVFDGTAPTGPMALRVVSPSVIEIAARGYIGGSYSSRMARAGGRPDGNPVFNVITEGVELRVEWTSPDQAKLQVWEAGKRAGQTQNNPPQVEVILTAR